MTMLTHRSAPIASLTNALEPLEENDQARRDVQSIGHPKLRLFGMGIFLGLLVGTSLSVAHPHRSRELSFETRGRITVAGRAIAAKTGPAVSWVSARLPATQSLR